jgi:hypothetical protein
MRVPRLQPPARSSGRGWVLFAGLMLLASSALNAVYGFSAIYRDDYVAEEEFLYGPVSLWGWLAVGIAVVMLITALGLFARSPTASLFGILIAGLNAVVHLLAIGANTGWSILVIAVDALIIYGLSTHGFDYE